MNIEFSDEYADDQDEIPEKQFRSDVVMFSTDWTTETILGQLEKKNIDIDPQFQRRDAWDITKKSRFIESIMLGLPIPQLVLAEKISQRGKYLVLDGKQRLTTLIKFIGLGDKTGNNFKLSNLQVLKKLNGRTYSDLINDIELSDDLNQFQNHTIRSVVIRNWSDNDMLNMIFVRLNTGSVQLSPQELRQALYPGSFTEWADSFTSDSVPLKKLLNSNEPDFRMRDIEIFVRFIGFAKLIKEYSGDMKKFLDQTCDTFNKKWDEQHDEIKTLSKEFEKGIDAGFKIFDRNFSRKWKGTETERNLNRAILDVMLFYLSDIKYRELLVNNADSVRDAFQNLCNNDPNFRTSIETTTKSLSATYTRFSTWGKTLRKILSINIPIVERDQFGKLFTIDI